MKIRYTSNLLYQILFAICVAVTYLNIYELTFGVWVLTFLVTLRPTYSWRIVKYVLCFTAIFLIALVSSFYNEYKTYNFFRDVTYMVKPVLGLLVGYQLCRNMNIKPFHTILYTGLFIAVVHLGMILYSMAIYRIINIHELRHHTGYFSDFEIYACIVLCFHKAFEIRLTRQKLWLFAAILAFSSFLYLARTGFIQFFVLYLAMRGYLRLTKRSIIIISSIVIATVASYTVIYNMNFTRNGKGLEGLMYKIKNAPIEAFKTKIDADDWRDFNDNYRSYENIITVNQVSYQGTGKILFGKGMGATVDLGRKLWTNDGEFIRYLPTLHNGYMTVYLKSGLTGIFFYLLFLYFLSRQGKSDIPIVQKVNLLLSGTSIFLILGTWVLLGFYLKIDNKSLIVGLILAYKEITTRQASKQLQHAA